MTKMEIVFGVCHRNSDLLIGAALVGLVWLTDSAGREKSTWTTRIGPNILASVPCNSTSLVMSVQWYGPPWNPQMRRKTNEFREWRRDFNPFEPVW